MPLALVVLVLLLLLLLLPPLTGAAFAGNFSESSGRKQELLLLLMVLFGQPDPATLLRTPKWWLPSGRGHAERGRPRRCRPPPGGGVGWGRLGGCGREDGTSL